MTGLALDPRTCALGEGPLWHPERGQLFWFDIINMRLLSRAGNTALERQFDCHVSATGWVGGDPLMIASEVDLFVFIIETGTCKTLCPLEADQFSTRSDDSRADPWGGFWIDLKDAGRNPDGAVIDTRSELQGQTFCTQLDHKDQAEHRVIIQ